MPPPSRTRRILKWTGAALSLLIPVVSIASTWHGLAIVINPRHFVSVEGGHIAWVTNDASTYPVRTGTYEVDQPWQKAITGLPRREIRVVSPKSPSGITLYLMPLWTPFLLIAVATGWLWHRDRRRIPPGHCLRCGYNLTGNTSGVCSECGAPTPKPPVTGSG